LHKPQSELVKEISEQLNDTHLCASLLPDPARPHECSTQSAAEEQIGLSALSNPQPDLASNPSVTEIPAHARLDQNTDGWSSFPSASEDAEVDAEHVSMETIESLGKVVKNPVTEDRPQLSITTQGPPDSTLHFPEDHSGSDQPPQVQMLDVDVESDAQVLSNENSGPETESIEALDISLALGDTLLRSAADTHPSKDSLEADMSQSSREEQMLDVDVEADARLLSTEEDSGPQTESTEALNVSLALGETLLKPAADTLPTATVALDERPPCLSSTATPQTTDEEPAPTVTQSPKPTEAPEPSPTSVESNEQLFPLHFKKPPTLPPCFQDVPPFPHVDSVAMDEVALRHRGAWHEEKPTVLPPVAESLESDAETEKEDSHRDSPEVIPENLAAKPSNRWWKGWILPIVLLGAGGLLAVLFSTVSLH